MRWSCNTGQTSLGDWFRFRLEAGIGGVVSPPVEERRSGSPQRHTQYDILQHCRAIGLGYFAFFLLVLSGALGRFTRARAARA